MARPLYRAGRISSSGPRLFEGFILAASAFVIVTSAFLTPVEGRACIVECSLSPSKFRLGVWGADMDALVSGGLREALCRARRIQVAAVVLCRVRGDLLVALPRGWRDLASRCLCAR